MEFSRDHDHITLTAVIKHDGDGLSSKLTVWLATFIIVFSFVFYIAAQFQGAGSTFATTFELSMSHSIILGAFIIMLYTLLGGFWAVSVTDALQGSLMGMTALVLPTAALIAVGGLDGLLHGLQSLSSDAQLSLTAGNLGWFGVGVIIGGLSIGLGTFGQPHLMARIMALRDNKALRQARWMAIAWYIVVFLGMWLLGLIGHVLHTGLENSEQIFFVMLDDLFPPVIAAILLAAILSAIMSTADSQLLSAAAAIAHDLGIAGESEQRVLLISRLTIVTLVVVSVCVAIYLPDKIFSRVLFAWVALGAAFGPTLFARLANISIKPVGVLVSILTGFCLAIGLSFLPNSPGDIAERLMPFAAASFMLFVFRNPKNATSEN